MCKRKKRKRFLSTYIYIYITVVKLGHSHMHHPLLRKKIELREIEPLGGEGRQRMWCTNCSGWWRQVISTQKTWLAKGRAISQLVLISPRELMLLSQIEAFPFPNLCVHLCPKDECEQCIWEETCCWGKEMAQHQLRYHCRGGNSPYSGAWSFDLHIS